MNKYSEFKDRILKELQPVKSLPVNSLSGLFENQQDYQTSIKVLKNIGYINTIQNIPKEYELSGPGREFIEKTSFTKEDKKNKNKTRLEVIGFFFLIVSVFYAVISYHFPTILKPQHKNQKEEKLDKKTKEHSVQKDSLSTNLP